MYSSIFGILIFSVLVATIPNANSITSGDYVVTDRQNGRLLKVTQNGTATTITSALVEPRGVAIDSSGNYIVTTLENNAFSGRLLKVTTDGTVTTIANGLLEPWSIAIDASGNYIVTELGGSYLTKITPGGTITKILSINTFLYAVAIDSSGNYIVTDGFTQSILKVTPEGTATTITSNLGILPWGIAVDSDGNYIVVGNTKILKVTPEGIVSTISSNSGFPNAIVLDSSGNYIIADNDGKVLKVTKGGTVSTITSDLGSLYGIAINIPKTQQQAIKELITLGNSLGVNTNVLGNVVKLLNDSNPYNDNGACGKLGAFINQVNTNYSLTSAQKTQLVAAANAIKTSIGC